MEGCKNAVFYLDAAFYHVAVGIELLDGTLYEGTLGILLCGHLFAGLVAQGGILLVNHVVAHGDVVVVEFDALVKLHVEGRGETDFVFEYKFGVVEVEFFLYQG